MFPLFQLGNIQHWNVISPRGEVASDALAKFPLTENTFSDTILTSWVATNFEENRCHKSQVYGKSDIVAQRATSYLRHVRLRTKMIVVDRVEDARLFILLAWKRRHNQAETKRY